MAAPRDRANGGRRGRGDRERSGRDRGNREQTGRDRGGRGVTGRPAPGRSGRGTPARGTGNGPLFILLGVGGALVVVLLAVLFLGGEDPVETPMTVGSAAPSVTESTGRKDVPPAPLTAAEVDDVVNRINRVSMRRSEAVEEIEAGFESQNDGLADEAQAHWRKAHDILTGMIEEANAISSAYGEKRLQYWVDQGKNYRLEQAWEEVGKWSMDRARFMKYLH